MAKLINQNIKKTLIISIILITVFPTMIISIFYYFNIVNDIEINTVDSIYENLKLLSGGILKQINSVEQISNVILMDNSINNLLEKNEKFTGNYDEINRIEQQLQNLIISLGLNKYTSSVSIIGANGTKIVAGSDTVNTYFYEPELASEKQKKPFYINSVPDKSGNFIISYIKPLIHSYQNVWIGWMSINLNKYFISEVFNNYSSDKESYYFVIDQFGKCIFQKNEDLINKDLSNLDYIKTMLNYNNGYFNIKIDGKEKLIVFNHVETTDWTIVQVLSYSEMILKQNKILEQLIFIIFLSSIIIITVFTTYFNRNLSAPLRSLLKKIQEIAVGNFDSKSNIQVKNELSLIDSGINNMSQNIKIMMEQVVEQEKAKRDLEFKVLQSQINPHFLYNTLNSVKWMAEIKNTEGVIKMVYVLGNLIRNISSMPSEKTTLRKEKLLLDDYVYIQRIRYKGKVKLEYNIESDSLLDKKIIKFTLQPIVENAIFHGIEAKKGIGHITISLKSDRQNVVICVEDDGVGMSKERVEQVLLREDDNKDGGVSGIGLKNVDDRLKITYGEQYGLKIESMEGEFTRIFITIPMEDDNENV
jgi:two-component system, sensor histidine kinase YesM